MFGGDCGAVFGWDWVNSSVGIVVQCSVGIVVQCLGVDSDNGGAQCTDIL